jgi:hypothetical protein
LKKKSGHEDVYVLDIELSEANKRTRKLSYEKSVAKYFDEDGVLCTKPLFTDLCKYFSAFNNEEKKSK